MSKLTIPSDRIQQNKQDTAHAEALKRLRVSSPMLLPIRDEEGDRLYRKPFILKEKLLRDFGEKARSLGITENELFEKCFAAFS